MLKMAANKSPIRCTITTNDESKYVVDMSTPKHKAYVTRRHQINNTNIQAVAWVHNEIIKFVMKQRIRKRQIVWDYIF